MASQVTVCVAGPFGSPFVFMTCFEVLGFLRSTGSELRVASVTPGSAGLNAQAALGSLV